MKNRFEILQTMEVPEELDRKILAAASRKAELLRHRNRMIRFVWSVSASAAALLVGGTVFLLPLLSPQPPATPTKQVAKELLELSDWSGIELESYSLSFELYSGRQSVAELASTKLMEEF